jgi:hypothetical protein
MWEKVSSAVEMVLPPGVLTTSTPAPTHTQTRHTHRVSANRTPGQRSTGVSVAHNLL